MPIVFLQIPGTLMGSVIRSERRLLCKNKKSAILNFETFYFQYLILIKNNRIGKNT